MCALATVVPWGRSFDEYRRMFALGADDLRLSILGCGDGPASGAFDLALSSHFLFLYTAQLGKDFHRRAVREMCRVAREVRIFPLLALGGAPSPLVDVVMTELSGEGATVSIESVPYEFQRGANRMLRIRRERGQPHA